MEYEAKLRSSDRSEFGQAGPFWWWSDLACFLNLLIDAEQTIRGETTASDKLKLAIEKTMAQRWTESPQLVAFDQAVLFGTVFELKSPKPLLARGRRLAELGRFDEAEADFNKAVELKPDDPELLIAHHLHADRGSRRRRRTSTAHCDLSQPPRRASVGLAPRESPCKLRSVRRSSTSWWHSNQMTMTPSSSGASEYFCIRARGSGRRTPGVAATTRE